MDGVVGQVRVGDVSLNAADCQGGTKRSAPAILDHITQ